MMMVARVTVTHVIVVMIMSVIVHSGELAGDISIVGPALRRAGACRRENRRLC